MMKYLKSFKINESYEQIDKEPIDKESVSFSKKESNDIYSILSKLGKIENGVIEPIFLQNFSIVTNSIEGWIKFKSIGRNKTYHSGEKKVITIKKYKDEWYLVIIPTEASPKYSRIFTRGYNDYYLCDQFDGLVNCIKEKFKSISIK